MALGRGLVRGPSVTTCVSAREKFREFRVAFRPEGGRISQKVTNVSNKVMMKPQASLRGAVQGEGGKEEATGR